MGPKIRNSQPESLDGRSDFFRLLEENAPFFSLKLRYEGDRLAEWQLNGKDMTGSLLPEGNT